MTGFYTDDFDDFEVEDLGLSCDYGFTEFCEEPQTREIGLCTTDCRAYMEAVEHMDQEQESEWMKVLRSEGKCGACEGSLAQGHINGMMLNKYATWEFPAWGNILARDEDKQQTKRATTFLCDDCIKLRQMGRGSPVKWAYEIYQEDAKYKIRYHDVEQLKDADPITEEDLEA